jgi:hypothetical protein
MDKVGEEERFIKYRKQVQNGQDLLAETSSFGQLFKG